MKSQDDIDTVPVLPKEGDLATHQQVELEPGSRMEVEVSPRLPMRAPMLLVAVRTRAAEVSVEQVACGNIVIVDETRPASYYKFGQQLGSLVTRDDPIRVLLRCGEGTSARVRVSLVAATADKPGSYEIVNKKE